MKAGHASADYDFCATTLVKKEVAKNKPVKAANAEELSGLRNSCRRLAAYGKALAAADKALNKPKKKAKKRNLDAKSGTPVSANQQAASKQLPPSDCLG